MVKAPILGRGPPQRFSMGAGQKPDPHIFQLQHKFWRSSATCFALMICSVVRPRTSFRIAYFLGKRATLTSQQRLM